MPHWFQRLALLLTALSLSACAVQKQAYEGAKRPYAELATLYVEGFSGLPRGMSFKLLAVDGRSVDAGGGILWVVDVLPGKHELKIWTNKVLSADTVRQGDGVLTLEVNAGEVVGICSDGSRIYIKRLEGDPTGELRRNAQVQRPVCDVYR